MGTHDYPECARISLRSPRSSPYRFINRGIGEVRRRFIFFSTSAFLLITFLVGLRRQEQVKGWVDYSRQNPHSEVPASIKTALEGSNLPPTSEEKPMRKVRPAGGNTGPVLGSGIGLRSLSKHSLSQLRNETLGVCAWNRWWARENMLTKFSSGIYVW